ASIAGNKASEVVYQKTNNEILATMTGAAVGMLTYGGMSKYDSVKNVSGYYKTSEYQTVLSKVTDKDLAETRVKVGSNLGKGAYNGNIYDGSGLGKLTGKNINVTEKGINIVKQHLSGEFSDITNDAMIKRLENALANGEKISGADASFYMHEITETTLMNQGMTYDVAHGLALEKYDVSPFSVYSPEVVTEYPDLFSRGFKKYWDIK
ncbi:hypothetical protein, partial [Lachnotalea glycerini]